jgi:hypothetical protein
VSECIFVCLCVSVYVCAHKVKIQNLRNAV